MSTPLALYKGQPAATETVLFPASGASALSSPVTVTSILACNTTGNAATFSLSALAANETAGDTNRLCKAVSVPANGVWEWAGEMVLVSEGSLSGLNGTTGAITLTISGRGA